MPEDPTAASPDVVSTPPAVADEALATLRGAVAGWCATGLDARIDLLDETLDSTLAAAPAWVDAARVAEDLAPGDPLVGEEWLTGVVPLVRHLALLRRTLVDLRDTGRPQPARIRVDPDGRVIVDVHPSLPGDGLLFARHAVEARLAPGVSRDEAMARMGGRYRVRVPDPGGVAVVLGAGNLSSIPPMDALAQLFVHDRTVAVKMSPVNAPLGPHLAEALEPLVRRGVLRLVYGDTEVGERLAHHPEVDAVHVTGSRATYDAVVRGRQPSTVTAELESVTPVIVVPGPWGAADVRRQGHHLASMLVSNAGFNCVAPRVVVQHRSWAGRRRLVGALRDSLGRARPRRARHPGARARWEAVVAAHPEAERFGPDERGVPYTLISDLDPYHDDELLFRTDPFCGIVGEVGLDAPRSVPAFVEAAVRFCNDRLAGTLAATVLVHPRSMLDPAVAAAVAKAVDDLDYGVVAVNTWPGVTFALVAPPWGPAGGTGTSSGSGIGFVHNTYLVDDVVKTVHTAPFRVPGTPPWFHTHRHTHRVGPALAEVAASGDRGALAAALAWTVSG